MSRRALLLLLVVAPLTPALAQGVGPDEVRLTAASSLERTRGARVRWDDETGTFASVRFERGAPIRADSPALAARQLLAEELSPLLERGVVAVPSDELAPATGPALVLRGTRDLGNGRVRVDFDQVVGKVLVRDARIQIELAATEAGFFPVSATGRYLANVPAEAARGGAPSIEASLVERYPHFASGELTARTTIERAIVKTSEGAKLVFVVSFVAGSPALGYEAIVDATTGKELARTVTSPEATAQGLVYEKNPGETPRAKKPLVGLYVNQGQNRATTDANGTHNLAGTVTLDQALSGPLLRVFIDNEAELTYSGPADLDLAFDEASAHQDELAAWHHVTSYNAYLQATYKGSQTPASNRFALLVRAKRNGQPFANAFYTPNAVTLAGDSFPKGYIAMGTFGANQAARSSTVVRHEYTHALLQQIVRLGGTLEAGGLNEGLADYFPCAQAEDPKLGAWLTTPELRNLTRKLVWPADNNGDVHRVGHIFAGALWRARAAAEARIAGDRLKVDQAVFGGVLRLRNVPSLIDAREAIVEADRATNGGTNVRLLEQALFEGGIGPAPSGQNVAPVLGTLADKDVQVGQTLTVTVTAKDPDGDGVKLSASALPNATFDAKTGTFTFKPDAAQVGPVRETFTATDGLLSASTTITITVKPASVTPRPPILLPPSLAPAASNTAPVGSARPASTSGTTGFASGARSGGGGGGGCALSTTGAGDARSLLPYALAIAVAASVRRRR